MHERIAHGANLLKKHVFQFDFLNDDFTQLPQSLQDIINDDEKRKKLVIYINPPYAEAASAKTVSGTGENKANTAVGNKIHAKYKGVIGNASNELFTQFLIRIYKEIPNCKLANFSKLKNLQASNFKDFRTVFRAKLEKIFLVPADSFDNVKGKFPIGFFFWDLNKDDVFKEIKADIYNIKSDFSGQKQITNFDDLEFINSWYSKFYDNKGIEIGVMNTRGNDFQNQNYIRISSFNNFNHTNIITQNNLIQTAVYIAVRHCIKANWLNDRDQFLFPNKNWKTDKKFKNNCLAYTLFDNSNNISTVDGTNHWIPFTEQEVNAKEKFESNFMSRYLKDQIPPDAEVITIFNMVNEPKPHFESPLIFSEEAKAVFDAGRQLWKYYHAQSFENTTEKYNVNASFYDIRAHFQGRNEKGRMNAKSDDAKYTELLAELRAMLCLLADAIIPKIYEYEFLKE